MATGITVRCCCDARCRQCTGKRLSLAIWSSFNNKESMSHLCDSTVAVQCTGKQMRIPPFRYPPLLNVPYVGHAKAPTAGHTYGKKSRIPLCFRNPTERKFQIPIFLLVIVSVRMVKHPWIQQRCSHHFFDGCHGYYRNNAARSHAYKRGAKEHPVTVSHSQIEQFLHQRMPIVRFEAVRNTVSMRTSFRV